MAEAILLLRLLRLAEVEQITGLKKSSIYDKMKKGKFPAAVKLGARHVAWRSDEVYQWVDDLPSIEGG